MQTPYPCVANDSRSWNTSIFGSRTHGDSFNFRVGRGSRVAAASLSQCDCPHGFCKIFAPRPMYEPKNPILRQHYLNPVILDIHDRLGCSRSSCTTKLPRPPQSVSDSESLDLSQVGRGSWQSASTTVTEDSDTGPFHVRVAGGGTRPRQALTGTRTLSRDHSKSDS